ncbi:MAG: carboxypeptidase-like regulatory domain-containing protein [Acidimicrobiia bacterium]|nr:carboxypeptidase-like regulatory domain-containing protein [Acidimicrobiia bacterium]
MIRRLRLPAGLLAGLVVVGGILLFALPADRTIHGRVLAADGTPVVDAIVRIQATDVSVRTASDGGFVLESGQSVRLSAWAPGFYIAGGEEHAPGSEATFTLSAVPDADHPEYEWLGVEAGGGGEAQGCAACHSRDGTDLPFALPVDEWRQDAHGQSAQNPRFITMYLGTDVAGRLSPSTRYVSSRDYGRVPLAPDPSRPYYGPGYKLDFPDTAGNCGACHLPVAAADDPYGVEPGNLVGVAAEGITCDFCHKIWDVSLDADTAMPLPNRPGVLSFELLRPPEGHQFFTGPFDDVAPGEDTYSPLQTQSAYCAPCHHAVFWDTVVYDSYGEWLRSPYSDPETGRTCQDCHTPATGATVFVRPDAGGLTRDPETIRSHLMPGAGDEELLANAVTVTASAVEEEGRIAIEVTITNDRTGHHVPTDSPLRHLILLVAATDGDGTALSQLDGPVVPDWAGRGDPETGHFAGLPGTAYAKVLEELWTEVSPTGAYWNPTRVLSDNRIAALDRDTTRYVFAAPPTGPVAVEVTLLFRRAHLELMEQKGWVVPDIEMAHLTVRVDG